MAEIASFQVEVKGGADKIAKAIRDAEVEGEASADVITAARKAAASLVKHVAKRGETLLVGATIHISDREPDGFQPAQVAVSASRVHPEVIAERERLAAEAEAAEQARHEEEVERQAAIAEGTDPIEAGIGEGMGLDEYTDITDFTPQVSGPWHPDEDPDSEAARA